MQDKMYIYGLLDPTVSQIRYIGYTDDVNERYPAHLADASNCRKARWIRSLDAVGLKPLLVILETVRRGSEDECETKWIAFGLSLGWQLTNEKKVSRLERENVSTSIPDYTVKFRFKNKTFSADPHYDIMNNYVPDDVYEAIKNNLYRPIHVDDCILFLAKDLMSPYPQELPEKEGKRYAKIAAMYVMNGKVRYNQLHGYRIPYELLPPYAIASLDIERERYGMSAEYIYTEDECSQLGHEYFPEGIIEHYRENSRRIGAKCHLIEPEA